LHWAAFLVSYIGAALLMAEIEKRYEKNANKYANEMMARKEVEIK